MTRPKTGSASLDPHTTIIAGKSDFEALQTALDAPPKPGEALRKLMAHKPNWHNETDATIARHSTQNGATVTPVTPMPFAESAKPSNPKDVMSLKKVPLLSVLPLNVIAEVARGMSARAMAADDTTVQTAAPFFSILPLDVLAQVALGLLEGALKYSRHNYRVVGVRASVYVDATARHAAQFWAGDDLDADSKAGLHHVDKAIASLTVLSDSIKRGNWVDDRPPRCAEDWAVLNMKSRYDGGVYASDCIDEAMWQLAKFWEGSDRNVLDIHRVDMAMVPLFVLSAAIKNGSVVDDRGDNLDPSWADKANKIAEELVKQAKDPIPPTTQKLIDEAHARGEEPVLPTGRRE
jgi:Domain of unknown function (DUF5664)/Protein of unknown function (DUF1778)